MNIQEATKQALAKGKAIIRPGLLCPIIPTNTKSCCIIDASDIADKNSDCGYKPGGEFVRKWNPRAEDLTADDWELTD